MIRVGTSGFSYQHWRGVFYPEDIPQRRWLEFYAEHFDCVEINSSFYHLPDKATLISWRKRTPEKFLFILKGSRYVSHIKRLQDCADAVKLFYERAQLLEEKLGPVLWQLPPRFGVDPARLESFLSLLPTNTLPVLEFRDPGWFVQQIYQLLEARRAALCVHDMPKCNCPEIIIGPLLYLRFHGVGSKYSGNYNNETLRRYADWAGKSGARHIYAFFNNDSQGYAVGNAITLREMLKQTWKCRKRVPGTALK
jgi:uncharacterized protein YecE (DUF72 family)